MKQRIMIHLPEDFPWQVHWFETVPSTNDLLKQWGKEGAAHGSAVIADRQTGGRGRLGRSFHSPAGCGIYLSVLLRPRCNAKDLMHLTCAVATAVCDAVEAVCGFRPGVKWINDLVCGSKKLGGILTELSLDAGGNAEYCVIGIGLNCKKTSLPEDLAHIATSLEDVTGQEPDRFHLIAQILSQLKQMDADLITGKTRQMAKYKQDCITLGKEIQVIRGQERCNAFAEELDPQGGLIVRYPDGRQETVNSGEVSIRGMYGYL